MLPRCFALLPRRFATATPKHVPLSDAPEPIAVGLGAFQNMPANEDRLHKATQARFPSPFSNCFVYCCVGETAIDRRWQPLQALCPSHARLDHSSYAPCGQCWERKRLERNREAAASYKQLCLTWGCDEKGVGKRRPKPKVCQHVLVEVCADSCFIPMKPYQIEIHSCLVTRWTRRLLSSRGCAASTLSILHDSGRQIPAAWCWHTDEDQKQFHVFSFVRLCCRAVRLRPNSAETQCLFLSCLSFDVRFCKSLYWQSCPTCLRSSRWLLSFFSSFLFAVVQRDIARCPKTYGAVNHVLQLIRDRGELMSNNVTFDTHRPQLHPDTFDANWNPSSMAFIHIHFLF